MSCSLQGCVCACSSRSNGGWGQGVLSRIHLASRLRLAPGRCNKRKGEKQRTAEEQGKEFSFAPRTHWLPERACPEWEPGDRGERKTNVASRRGSSAVVGCESCPGCGGRGGGQMDPWTGATQGPLTTRSWWFECLYDMKCSSSYLLVLSGKEGRGRISLGALERCA